MKQTPVTQITKAQVIELVHGKRTGLSEQTNLLTTVRRCFRWGSAHDLCTDPTTGVRKPLPKSVQRDRILDDKEIVAFWSACGEIGWHFRPLSGAKAQVAQGMGVTDWRIHDLRRTCATGTARLGVPLHVAEKVLNHTSGTISGVAAPITALATRRNAATRSISGAPLSRA